MTDVKWRKQTNKQKNCSPHLLWVSKPHIVVFCFFFFEEVLKEEMVAKVLGILIILETCSSCFNFV